MSVHLIEAPKGRARYGRHAGRMIRLLLLAGFGCFAVMVFTHVAEAMRWLPGMGWGLPDSPGHYLDLFSAILGAAFLLAAGVLRLLQSK